MSDSKKPCTDCGKGTKVTKEEHDAVVAQFLATQSAEDREWMAKSITMGRANVARFKGGR